MTVTLPQKEDGYSTLAHSREFPWASRCDGIRRPKEGCGPKLEQGEGRKENEDRQTVLRQARIMQNIHLHAKNQEDDHDKRHTIQLVHWKNDSLSLKLFL